MRRTVHSLALAVLALGALLPSARALASASPRPIPGPPGLPAVSVVGEASAGDVRIFVSCEPMEGALPTARCAVRASFLLTAGPEPVELRAALARIPNGDPIRLDAPPSVGGLGPREPGLVSVGGTPLSDPRTLEAGQSVLVEVEATRVLATRRAQGDGWIMPAMRARHLVLGEVISERYGGEATSGAILEGVRVRVEGPVRIEARRPDFVTVEVGAAAIDGASASLTIPRPSVAIRVDPPDPSGNLVQNGGPVLWGGARFRLDLPDDEGRFVLRGGYEIGFAEHFFLSVAFETDFESIFESAVVEVATPAILLLPSVFAGVGVVARQLGDRDADAALRLRAGVGLYVLALNADFDYWPAIGEWTASMAVRASI